MGNQFPIKRKRKLKIEWVQFGAEEPKMKKKIEGLGSRGKRFTVRNSLSSRGGYRGGCGAREGVDLQRRTPNLFHRLPARGTAGCAWERTKVMDGSVGSSERIPLSKGGKGVSMTTTTTIDKKRKEEERGDGSKGKGRGWAKGRGVGGCCAQAFI